MPESQNTEYKQTWRDENLKWISGFANAEGGVLVIGRDDAGKVVGVKDASKLLEDIPNKVRDLAKLLGDHASHPFNPDIANTFFRAGEIESWGRGIQRIFEACQQGGAPDPEIRLSGHDLWTEFPFSPDYLKLIDASSVETPVKTPVKTPVETPVKTPDRILEAFKSNPEMTLAEVAQSIGRSKSAVERASAKLVKAGKLRHIGPTKAGRWEVLK